MPSPIAISIVLAIASGLSIVAFKTPRIFQRMVRPLLGLLFVMLLITFAWGVGFTKARSIVRGFIPSEKFEEVSCALDAVEISPDFYLYIIVALLFVGFLHWLSHEVMAYADDQKPRKKMDDE